jgi:deazaflavin-dependent oxidoreductase (nitroreductase family)
VTDWNTAIIEEFRSNAGQVGGRFEGRALLLLHHVGARTGAARISPLIYERFDGGYAIFASKGGAPAHPHWYHNIVANPDTRIEVGDQTVSVRARVAGQAEREPIWEQAKRNFQPFAEYEEKTRTHRTIPVILLEPRG